MKKEILLSLIGILLLVPIASAQVLVSPETFEISLVGGQNYSQSFTVEWKGEVPVVGYLSYSVKQLNGTYDGRELWINFSQGKIILEPNKPKDMQMFIYTLPNIQPDTYTLKVEVRVDVEKPEPETITRTEYLPGGVWIKYQNVTENITVEKEVYYENKTRIEELENLTKSLNQTILNQTQTIEQGGEEIAILRDVNRGYLTVLIMFAIIIICLASWELYPYILKLMKKKKLGMEKKSL